MAMNTSCYENFAYSYHYGIHKRRTRPRREILHPTWRTFRSQEIDGEMLLDLILSFRVHEVLYHSDPLHGYRYQITYCDPRAY